jgi:hypothetical protein
VSLIIIDGVVDLPTTRQRMKDKPDSFFVKPSDVADRRSPVGVRPCLLAHGTHLYFRGEFERTTKAHVLLGTSTMRKTRKRTLILSLASATAGFALPSCGDSSDSNNTVVTPPGSVAAPYDASGDATPIMTGSFIAPPDAGDAPEGDAGDAAEGDAPRMLGSVVQPPDASVDRELPGIVINPGDGSASG